MVRSGRQGRNVGTLTFASPRRADAQVGGQAVWEVAPGAAAPAAEFSEAITIHTILLCPSWLLFAFQGDTKEKRR